MAYVSALVVIIKVRSENVVFFTMYIFAEWGLMREVFILLLSRYVFNTLLSEGRG